MARVNATVHPVATDNDVCAIREPLNGLAPCPDDSRPQADVNELPPPGSPTPCTVDGLSGTCMAKTACDSKSYPGTKDPFTQKWPCGPEEGIECCVKQPNSDAPPPPDPSGIHRPAPLNGKCQGKTGTGICKDSQQCADDGSFPDPGEMDKNGNWPCAGDDSIICCMKPIEPTNLLQTGPTGIQRPALLNGRCRGNTDTGICKDSQQCKNEGNIPDDGEKDKNGNWPCVGNAICCVESLIHERHA